MLVAPQPEQGGVRCWGLADENFNLFLTPWEPWGAGSGVSTHYNLTELQTKLREVFTITVKAASTRALSRLKAPNSTLTLKYPLRHYAKEAITQGK